MTPGDRALARTLARVVGDDPDAVGVHLSARVRVQGLLVVIRDSTVTVKAKRDPAHRAHQPNRAQPKKR